MQMNIINIFKEMKKLYDCWLRAACVLVVFLLSAGTVLAEFELLKSTDPVVRMKEIQRLGNQRVEEALPELIQALKDENTGVRINAIVALRQLRAEESIEPLIEVMNDDSSKACRIMAAQALGRFSDEKARNALLEASDNEDENIRATAIRSLGRTGTQKDIEKLIEKAEKDKSWRVREAAVTALTNIVEMGNEGKDNRAAIEKMIKKRVRRDKSSNVKKSAGRALERLEKVPKKDKKK